MILLFLRTVILYAIVILGLRLSGKRQLGELSTSEFAVTMLVSEVASIPLQDVAVPLLGSIVPLLTLICLEIFIAELCRRSRRVHRLISGNPCIVIKNGKFDQTMLRNLRLSADDILEGLRLAGAPKLPDIRYAILETNGQLSVLLRSEAQPVTASGLNLHPSETGVPLILISNGEVIRHNLLELNKTEDWLLEQCKRHHLSAFEDVFLFTLDDSGNQFIQRREGRT